MSGYNFETWAIEFKADTSKFTKGVTRVNKAMATVRRNATKTKKTVNKAFKTNAFYNYAKAIENCNKRIIKSNSSLDKSFNSSSKGVRNYGMSFKGLLSNALKFLSIAALFKGFKDSIDLGASMTEVQHVVDTAFPHMSALVNKFAQSAIKSFGMSELSVKNYTGTLGSMLKSMGLTETAAAGMSMDLVRLAGDLASFYNIKSEDAFEKIRSGISGQIIPLKQLGVNLSVANLEAYAMANGIEKSYNEMSQAEKTLLRYNYLLSVTKDMHGDFAETSHTWANQTKILSERFKQLKGVLGQGFVMALLPTLTIINKIIERLIGLSTVFTIFVGKITGKSAKDISQGMGVVKDSVDDIDLGYSDVADDVAEGAEKKADKAEKKAKKAKKMMLSVMAFDKLNKLSDPNSGEDGKVTVETPKQDISKQLAGLNGKGIGKLAFEGVDIPEIDTTKQEEQANRLYGIYERTAGRIKGVLDRIKGFWQKHKDIIIPIVTSLAIGIMTAFALIKFKSLMDKVKGLGGIGKIFQTALSPISGTTLLIVAVVALLVLTIWDLWKNSETFRTSVIETWNIIKDTLSTIIEGIGKKFKEFWSEYGEPIIKGLKEAWKTWTEVFETAWLNVLKPIIDFLMKALKVLWKNILEPLLGVVLTLLGSVMTVILALWNNAIGPLLKMLLKTVGAVLKPILDMLLVAIKIITGLIKPIIELAEIIIKYVGKALVFAIEKIGNVLSVVNGFVDKGVEAFGKLWEGIKKIFSGIGEWFYNIFMDAIGGVTKVIEKITSPFKNNKKKGTSYSYSSIPQLANGGTVGAGQLFIAREKGPELIGGGSGTSTVMNNDQIVKSITDGVTDAMVKVFMSTNAQGQVQGNESRDIIIELDGEKLGVGAINGINKHNERFRNKLVIA